MKEINLRFNVSFSPRFIRVAAVVAIVLCAVPELDSESVTLSTYYPAPSGVYTNMITTNNTYLARDGGAGSRVGIGTATPTAKLHVNGDMIVQSNASVAGNVTVTGNEIVVGSSRVGYLITPAGVACTPTPYAALGVTNCPPTTYATMTSGVIARFTITSDQGLGQNGQGNMLCCTCPGACPL